MADPVRYAELESRALVAVDGPDWRGFLQGLLTQDVETLAPGEIRFAALLSPPGRLLFDLFVVGTPEGCLLDVAADRRDGLVARLALYRLRAKVDIRPVAGRPLAVLGAAQGAGLAPDPRLPGLGARSYGRPPPDGAARIDEAAYGAVRLALGAPDPDRDAPEDTTYPTEANFDLLNGVDFSKGCFVGQETTSRMKRRGGVRSRMMGLRFEGPAPAFGAEVLAGSLRAGDARTGMEGACMARLRLDRAEAGALTVEGRPARLVRPAYFPDPAEA